MQHGSMIRTERQRGADVWEFRWREPSPDGRRKHRSRNTDALDGVLGASRNTLLCPRCVPGPFRGRGGNRMLGRMLVQRAIAASDVAALRTPPKMKPPSFRDTRHSTHPLPLGFEAVLIPRRSFFISDSPFVPTVRKENVKPPAKPSRHHASPVQLERRLPC
jgi:hypothetical protein